MLVVPLAAGCAVALTTLAPSAAPTPLADAFPVTIRVDADQIRGELRPVWRFFGADEPNYATMPNGKKLLGELGALRPDAVYFRAHNLLTTGDGTPALKWGSTNAYTEDAHGNPVYDWTILDQIFDAYRASGVRPYVQIGFMPEALSGKPQPYRHHWTPTAKYDAIYTGWAYPPSDWEKWGELVYQWTKHCVARYGRAEVETWYWEVWNEANIGYWQGTPAEFHRLHDVAIAAVRRALPTARVGGSDVAGDGGQFQRDFFEHCLRGTNYATGEIGTPLDFVSFHAKGAPEFVGDHVRMGIANHLRTIDQGFALVAAFPELRKTPIIIGESDPEGCAACQGPQLGYRNSTMYSSYTAASLARELELASRHQINFAGMLTWAFTFENQPYFAGFRQLATNGIDLPVLSVFRMLSKMGGQQVAADSSHQIALDEMLQNGVRAAPDVAAIASVEPGKLCILVWHYHDDDVAGPDAAITLNVVNLPAAATAGGAVNVTHYRIDADHSNAFTRWQQMDSPAAPTEEQWQQLEKAGQLAVLSTGSVSIGKNNDASLSFSLPRQGVSLIVLE